MCVPRAPVAVHVGVGVAVSFIAVVVTVTLRVAAASGVSGGHDSSLLRVSPLSLLSELLHLHLTDVVLTHLARSSLPSRCLHTFEKKRSRV